MGMQTAWSCSVFGSSFMAGGCDGVSGCLRLTVTTWNGRLLYLTVKAQNQAFLDTYASPTRAVMWDITPPVEPSCGDITPSIGDTPHCVYHHGDVFATLTSLWDGHNTTADEQYSNVWQELGSRWVTNDPESEVSYHTWGYNELPSGMEDASLTNVGARTAYAIPATLLHAHKYHITLVTYNYAALSTRTVSNGLWIDLTNPFANTSYVYNSLAIANCTTGDFVGNSSGRICYQADSTPVVMWSGFWEDIAPIIRYEVAVGTSPGGTQLLPYTWAGLATDNFYNTRLNLPDGTIYYMTVRVFNCLEMASQTTSGFNMIDTSPPICTWVREGSGALDIDYSSANRSLYIRYGKYYDVHSGLASLAVSIAEGTPDAWDDSRVVVGWRPLEESLTYFFFDGIDLQPGLHFVRIRAINRAGLHCRSVTNGIFIDPTPPLVDLSRVHFPRYLSSLTTINATWAGAFSDPESGLLSVTWMVGATQSSSELYVVTYAPSVGGDLLLMNQELTHGARYYITCVVENRANLLSYVGPEAFVVDITPPVRGTVYLGTSGVERRFHTDPTTIAASWFGFSDPESPIDSIDVSLFLVEGTAPTLVAHARLEPEVLNHTFAGLELVAPRTTSSGVTFRVDATGPTVGMVFDGCGQLRVDEQWQLNGSYLCASWEGLDSPDEYNPWPACSTRWAPIRPRAWWRTQWVGRRRPTLFMLAHPPTPPPSPLHTAHPPTGVRYYFTVNATLQSGALRSVTSNGLVIDQSPPLTDEVAVLFAPHVARRTGLQVNWLGWKDPESNVRPLGWFLPTHPHLHPICCHVLLPHASRHHVLTSCLFLVLLLWATQISSYAWALYSQSPPALVYPLAYVGFTQTVTVPTDALPRGAYHLMLQATNGVGLTATVNASTFMVVEDAPTGGTVWLGSDCETSTRGHRPYQMDAEAVRACWDVMADPSGFGGLVHYGLQVFVNRAPTPAYTATLLPGVSTHLANLSGSPLHNGDVLVVTVTGINEAGLRTAVTSPSLAIDNGSPTVNYLRDGEVPASEAEYVAKRQVAAVWSFSAGSGMAKYEVQVRNGSCTGPALTGWTLLNGTATGYAFPPAEVQYDAAGRELLVVAVRATSQVGTAAELCTNGARFDGAPPTVGRCWVVGSRPSAALGLLEWPELPVESALAGAAFPVGSKDGGAYPFLPAAGERCLTVAWDGFADNQAGIAEYTLAVGKNPLSHSVAGPLSVGLRSPYTLCGLPEDQPLFVTVCARDYAGRESCNATQRQVVLHAAAMPVATAIRGRTPSGNEVGCEAGAVTGAGAVAEWDCWGLAEGLALTTATTAAPNGSLTMQVYLDASLAEGLCAAEWWVGSARLEEDLVARTPVALLDAAAVPAAVNLTVPLWTHLSTYYLHVRTYSCLREASLTAVAVHVSRAVPGLRAEGMTVSLLSGAAEAEAEAAAGGGALQVQWAAIGAPEDVPLLRQEWTVRDQADPLGASESGVLGPAATGFRTANGTWLVEGHVYEILHRAVSKAPGSDSLTVVPVIYDRSPPAVGDLHSWQEALAEEDLWALSNSPATAATFTGRLCAEWNVTDPQSGVRAVVVRWTAGPRATSVNGEAATGATGATGAVLGQWDSRAASDPRASRACVGPLVMANPLVAGQRLYATITVTNGMGLAQTAMARVARLVLPGPGTVRAGCGGTTTGSSGGSSLLEPLQTDPVACAQWSGFDPAGRRLYPEDDPEELAGTRPHKFYVALGKAPGHILAEREVLAPSDATAAASLLQFAAGSGGDDERVTLHDGETYWVQVRAVTPFGQERVAVSNAVELAARAPEVLFVRAEWVCTGSSSSGAGTGGGVVRSALATRGCDTAAATNTGIIAANAPAAVNTSSNSGGGLPTSAAIKLVWIEAGQLRDNVTRLQYEVYADDLPAHVALGPANVSLAGVPWEAFSTQTAARRYTLLLPLTQLPAPEGVLRCGRLYRARVTAISGFGLSHSRVSEPFLYCETNTVTGAFDPAAAQVAGTYAIDSRSLFDGYLGLFCTTAAASAAGAAATATSASLSQIVDWQLLTAPPKAFTVSSSPFFNLLESGRYTLPLSNIAALRLAAGLPFLPLGCDCARHHLLASPASSISLPCHLPCAANAGSWCQVQLRTRYRPESAGDLIAAPVARSDPFQIDNSPPTAQWSCGFAEGRWWALGTRPNATDLLDFTECNATTTAAGAAGAAGTATGMCTAPGPTLAGILQSPGIASVWASAVVANGVGLQAWAATSVRLARSPPALREAWLECVRESPTTTGRTLAAPVWMAAVGWRELIDLAGSGVANMTVTLYSSAGAQVAQRVLPAPGTAAAVGAGASPDATGRVTFAIATPSASGRVLCPYSARLSVSLVLMLSLVRARFLLVDILCWIDSSATTAPVLPMSSSSRSRDSLALFVDLLCIALAITVRVRLEGMIALPIFKYWGGSTRWLTMWGRWLMESHSFLSFLFLLGKIYFGEVVSFRRVLEHYFSGVVGPMCFFVSISFWLLTLVVPGSLIPLEVMDILPTWQALYLHLFPVIYVIIQLLLFPPPRMALLPHLLSFLTVGGGYLAYTVIVFLLFDSRWPYPILTSLPGMGTITVFFAGSVLFAFPVFFAFWGVQLALSNSSGHGRAE
ncbi:putative Versican core protein [Paratrimastix pyriformis]|uniref:Versican core protein n=1 Tax=Paratrimastix pyriformis TaxID=342808 RepID=A0ABQ8UFD5_9EUKA|nr:putative Versican core protein [Paratrimastix pyriformis]